MQFKSFLIITLILSFTILSSAFAGSIVTLNASNKSIDQGQGILFTANIIGGISPYNYSYNVYAFNAFSSSNELIANQFYTGVSSTSNSWYWMPSNLYIGNYLVHANVSISDSSNNITNFNNLTNSSYLYLNYNGTPSVNLMISNTALVSGQYITLIATASGGIPPYKYDFFNTSTSTPVAISGCTNLLTNICTIKTYIQEGGSIVSYNALITDNATTEFSANSISLSATVNSMPDIEIDVSNSTMQIGQLSVITATVNFGIPPFNLEFYNVSGSSQQSTNILITTLGGYNSISLKGGNNGGTFEFNVIATDYGTSTSDVFNSLPFYLTTFVGVTRQEIITLIPNVIVENNNYTIYNLTPYGTFTINFCGTDYNVTDNYVSPNSTGLTLGSNTYYPLYGINNVTPIFNESNCFIKLLSVNYTPPLKIATILFYVSGNTTTTTTSTTTTNTTSTTSTLSTITIIPPSIKSNIQANNTNTTITNSSSSNQLSQNSTTKKPETIQTPKGLVGNLVDIDLIIGIVSIIALVVILIVVR